MKRKIRWLPFLLALLLGLTACGGNTSLQDEPYAPVDYRLYPAPEGGYVGDTMPFVTEDGTLELYYLYDTDQNGQGYHPIYRYATRDLCGYEDQGMVLGYGCETSSMTKKSRYPDESYRLGRHLG